MAEHLRKAGFEVDDKVCYGDRAIYKNDKFVGYLNNEGIVVNSFYLDATEAEKNSAENTLNSLLKKDGLEAKLIPDNKAYILLIKTLPETIEKAVEWTERFNDRSINEILKEAVK
jgi:hypothetical protein